MYRKNIKERQNMMMTDEDISFSTYPIYTPERKISSKKSSYNNNNNNNTNIYNNNNTNIYNNNNNNINIYNKSSYTPDIRRKSSFNRNTRISLPSPYAAAHTEKAQLQRKIDIYTNKKTSTYNNNNKNNIQNVGYNNKKNRLPSRISRIQALKKRSSYNTPNICISSNVDNTTPTMTRFINNNNNNITPPPTRVIYYNNDNTTYDDDLYDDIDIDTGSTMATLVDEDNNNNNVLYLSDDEFTDVTSINTSFDVINDFEVLMPNLNQSNIMFDLFPQQLQSAIAFLQRAEFEFGKKTQKNQFPVLPTQTKTNRRKQTLVLDLDETLMHCARVKLDVAPRFEVHFDGVSSPGHIYVRPYAAEFLKAASVMFEVVIFTASTSPYANQVLDKLDPKGEYIHHRLYRQHCTFQCGGYVKDLRILGRDLKNTILVDNSPVSAAFQLDNFVPISTWQGDENDHELYDLLHHLTGMIDTSNVAKWLARRYGFRNYINAYRDEANINDNADDML